MFSILWLLVIALNTITPPEVVFPHYTPFTSSICNHILHGHQWRNSNNNWVCTR